MGSPDNSGHITQPGHCGQPRISQDQCSGVAAAAVTQSTIYVRYYRTPPPCPLPSDGQIIQMSGGCKYFLAGLQIFLFSSPIQTVSCCRGVAVSEQHGAPRVEGDPLQVGVHPGDGQPALLLLQVNTVHSTVQYRVQYSTV